jgi:hypothetical protein
VTLLNTIFRGTVSITLLSFTWLVVRFPFRTLNDNFTTIAAGTGNPAAITGLIDILDSAFTWSLILGILGVILWMFLRSQQRDVATQPYGGYYS